MDDAGQPFINLFVKSCRITTNHLIYQQPIQKTQLKKIQLKPHFYILILKLLNRNCENSLRKLQILTPSSIFKYKSPPQDLYTNTLSTTRIPKVFFSG